MVFDKMAAICPDFKCLGFQISDPIQNPDHLQANLFSTIWNPDFRSPLYVDSPSIKMLGDLKCPIVGTSLYPTFKWAK